MYIGSDDVNLIVDRTGLLWPLHLETSLVYLKDPCTLEESTNSFLHKIAAYQTHDHTQMA